MYYYVRPLYKYKRTNMRCIHEISRCKNRVTKICLRKVLTISFITDKVGYICLSQRSTWSGLNNKEIYLIKLTLVTNILSVFAGSRAIHKYIFGKHLNFCRCSISNVDSRGHTTITSNNNSTIKFDSNNSCSRLGCLILTHIYKDKYSFKKFFF